MSDLKEALKCAEKWELYFGDLMDQQYGYDWYHIHILAAEVRRLQAERDEIIKAADDMAQSLASMAVTHSWVSLESVENYVLAKKEMRVTK
ncbi:MAG: hypothetical protein PHQ35_11115 [Phycisphaerae bacterium]|nr:hypothetical protein [Phycisphaerae bacterium]